MGMYTVLSILFIILIWREIGHGPAFLTGESEPALPESRAA
jgi:hypothetical protein